MIAVVAMSTNRVIGADGKIPWHIPEDLRWFKEVTMGGILLMGRVTYESIGKPLPGRTTVVLSRNRDLCIPGVEVIHSLDELRGVAAGRPIFSVGGAEIFRITLPYCRALYLTEVKREMAGDRKFPVFEDLFRFSSVLRDTPDLRIVHYVNDEVLELPG